MVGLRHETALLRLVIHIVDQVLDWKLTRPEDKLEEEKEVSVREDKVTF